MSYKTFQELAIAENLSPEQQRYELVEAYHNVHKAVYGFRPRGEDLSHMSIDDLAELVRDLSMRESDEQCFAREKEESIQMMIVCGAPDRRTAERWHQQAA